MASLTTVTGLQLTFDPNSVNAVGDFTAVAGPGVTGVYGVAAHAVQIRETIDGFLSRLGIAASFVKLTEPNGGVLQVRASAVTEIRGALPDVEIAGAKTAIFVGGQYLSIQETPGAATAIITPPKSHP